MSDFRTVDLDAVLDQFESEFDEEEKEKSLEEKSRYEENIPSEKISVIQGSIDLPSQVENHVVSATDIGLKELVRHYRLARNEPKRYLQWKSQCFQP
jgi:hypothetical protein